MREFTRRRGADTVDEIWLLEHEPVYTLGIRGREQDAPAGSVIPVVASDRGGLITYHGPGQSVVYPLIDLRRRRLGLKALVEVLEQAVIDLVARQGITAQRRNHAPGVYVEDRKLASLGLRMIQGRSYHGLSLNVDMDLEPFERIHPCGYEGLQMTGLAQLGWDRETAETGRLLAGEIVRLLGYTRIIESEPEWTTPA